MNEFILPQPIKLKFYKNETVLTNFVALLFTLLGWFTHNKVIYSMGIFALSGALTNWLAIYMLFEKVPFLYGSGVIPRRFASFKTALKDLVMQQFFTLSHIEKFFAAANDHLEQSINIEPVLEIIDYEKIFQGLVESIKESQFGSMLAMVGGVKIINPLKEPFTEKLKQAIREISADPKFTQLLAQQMDHFHPEIVYHKVESMVEQRLAELTPEMVKIIIQNMIQKYLGWLVVWGGVFGGLIGLVASFF